MGSWGSCINWMWEMGGPRLFSQNISKIPRSNPSPPPPIKNVPSLNISETWKRYPFRADPPSIDLYLQGVLPPSLPGKTVARVQFLRIEVVLKLLRRSNVYEEYRKFNQVFFIKHSMSWFFFTLKVSCSVIAKEHFCFVGDKRREHTVPAKKSVDGFKPVCSVSA